ncbi:MAG: ribonuclease P protein component [Proteobacteria bacterium]|nr:ribonuclease P protein component [Pseudomonadota bacterium]
MADPGRFSRSDRLRHSRDFQRVSREGERFASRYFVVLVAGRDGAEVPSAELRLGVTVSRKVGNAVVRNRVKRAIREWFRTSRELWAGSGQATTGRDVVVIARREARDLRGAEFATALTRTLAQPKRRREGR